MVINVKIFSVFCSLLLGTILAIIMFILFNKNKYLPEYHGPNSTEFKNKIFKLDEKCYSFKPQMYMCPK